MIAANGRIDPCIIDIAHDIAAYLYHTHSSDKEAAHQRPSLGFICMQVMFAYGAGTLSAVLLQWIYTQCINERMLLLVTCPFTAACWLAGPLAWSIVAFRNSLVFHSLDKVGRQR